MSRNVMIIEGHPAVIAYDPEIEMFRGEFVGLNRGGADFYAKDIKGLKREGALSLKVFLEACAEDGVEPFRNFSGKLNLRIGPEIHEEIAALSGAEGVSINSWIIKAIENKLELEN